MAKYRDGYLDSVAFYSHDKGAWTGTLPGIGGRVGRTTRAEVTRRLGKPYKTTTLKHGDVELTWRWGRHRIRGLFTTTRGVLVAASYWRP